MQFRCIAIYNLQVNRIVSYLAIEINNILLPSTCFCTEIIAYCLNKPAVLIKAFGWIELNWAYLSPDFRFYCLKLDLNRYMSHIHSRIECILSQKGDVSLKSIQFISKVLSSRIFMFKKFWLFCNFKKVVICIYLSGCDIKPLT